MTTGTFGARSPDALYEAGLAHKLAGRPRKAQTFLEQALALAPDHADSLHLMGLLSFDARQFERAVEQISKAIRRDPKPHYLTSLGTTLLAQARFEEALQVFDKAVQLKPDDAELWTCFGFALAEARRPADAVLALEQALRLNPRRWDAAHRSGRLLLELKRYEEALRHFDLCEELQPNDATMRQGRVEALVNITVSLHEQKRFEEALAASQRAYALDPANPDICNNLAGSLQSLGRDEESLLWFDKAIALHPGNLPALNNKGFALWRLHRFDNALAVNLRVHALDPANADTCNTIGACLRNLRRDEEALSWFDKATELRPGFFIAWNNKAIALRQIRRFDEALATLRHMKSIAPDHFAVERGIEHIHLLTGNFEAGWAARAAQWKAQVLPAYYPKLDGPLWLGEDIAGKTLLIYADEGLGDTIHFARYVPMVAARGARVILIVDDALHPLLSALSGVSQSFPKSSPRNTWPAFDAHCAICSLPLFFPWSLDTIPSKPYLPTPGPDRVRIWETRLGAREKLRVGLVWSGKPVHDNDHNRSIPLRMFRELLEADATFVNLKPDVNASDKMALQESRLVDLTRHLTDFVETAALISCLDLVITVDTSVAHLAGALGRQTWILLPYTPDYRWLLDRNDSPWYPTARLFRQGSNRDYTSVLKRVRGELEARIAAFKPENPPAAFRADDHMAAD